MTPTPLDHHNARLGERRRVAAALEAKDRSLSLARGAVAAVAFLALVVTASRPAAVFLLALSAAVFVVLVVAHERLARRLVEARARSAFHEEAVARLSGSAGPGRETGERYADPAHPYAPDLDLFGRRSLFERLCAARTRAGQDRLASWLRRQSPVEQIRERQEAVRELALALDLREDLAVLGAEARRGVDSSPLVHWATGPRIPVPETLRRAAFIVSGAALVSLVTWGAGYSSALPFQLATLAVAACHLRARAFASAVLDGLGRPVTDLRILEGLFDRLAKPTFSATRLRTVQAALQEDGRSPSEAIERLGRWLEAHESKSNAFFGVLAFFLLWDLQLAARVEHWRRLHGPRIAGWIDALGEMEALASLGAYTFENPEDVFPEFVDGPALFEAKGLTHPLLRPEIAVRNDVRLGAGLNMLVITGSNMSGKSTFLRSVGINTALALSGGPVRARSLRLTPLAIGASICTQDSLQDGASRFYAEIRRVRQILDLATEDAPALFLLDEIFDGTNSAERRIGAEAVVKALLERSALGLVTSHDLALAEIAVSLAPRAANIHFEDHLEGDRMAFDYLIKEGPVQRGNALGLMRAVGLTV